jgi:acetyl esterase/lipase
VPVALFVTGVVFAGLTATSLWPPRRPGTWALAIWFPAWLVSELPLHHLIVEVVLIGLLIGSGGLGAPIGWAGLALAIAAAAGLVVHVRDALLSTRVLDDALAQGLGEAAAPGTSRLGLAALALIFPFRPPTVERIKNLCYHRHGRRQMCLDVYRGRTNLERAPIFLYVHGGGWMIGHKGQQGRLLAHRLAEAGWLVVSINYRLSPRATFPDHLHDVKRAIAWVRANAAEHGGDPAFVVIGGGSAGAHLASLAALTPNVLEYQRDFPDVDTTLQGCVAFYGVYDFVDRDRDFPHRAFRTLLLERIVMKRRFADAPEEFDKASPRFRLGAHAPPFMLLHGTRDTLAPIAGARRFRDELRAVSHEPVVWAELPGAQHAFEVFRSVRAAAAVIAVERFCATIHARWIARSTVGRDACQR